MTRAALVVGVGGEPGLGAALCRRFAREGLHVFVSGRTRERIEALARSIREHGGRASAAPADATDAAQVARVFDAVEAETGAPPALVVFNVGKRVLTALPRDGCGLLRARLAGVLPRRLPRRPGGGAAHGAGGRRKLLFTGATASQRARPPFVAFASAKHGLRALTFGMAREFGPQGLHVAHVIVDGGIAGEPLLSRAPALAERAGPDGLLAPDAIADAYWHLHEQHRSAWTLELDLRPYKEPF